MRRTDKTGVFDAIAAKAEAAACINPAVDYKAQDGLWRCGRCHNPKQTKIQWPGLGIVAVYCMCKCEQDRTRQYKRDREDKERDERMRRESMSDMETEEAKRMTLDRDNGRNPFMSKLARKYVENWETLKDSGMGGMVFWGEPGTGKTFFATAIGHELINRGVSVARVTAAQIVQNAQGLYDYEKGSFISLLNKHELLILDDIGAERDTPFARETIFLVVDSRVNRKLPIIATTNLTAEQMRDPKDRNGGPDMGYKRIFDRLLSVSTPVVISGESQRKQQSAEAREVLKGVVKG